MGNFNFLVFEVLFDVFWFFHALLLIIPQDCALSDIWERFAHEVFFTFLAVHLFLETLMLLFLILNLGFNLSSHSLKLSTTPTFNSLLMPFLLNQPHSALHPHWLLPWSDSLLSLLLQLAYLFLLHSVLLINPSAHPLDLCSQQLLTLLSYANLCPVPCLLILLPCPSFSWCRPFQVP